MSNRVISQSGVTAPTLAMRANAPVFGTEGQPHDTRHEDISEQSNYPTYPTNFKSYLPSPERTLQLIESATHPQSISVPGNDRLMNARQVAAKLGVSERWVSAHTTRRSPRIRGLKMGSLMRYRLAKKLNFLTTDPGLDVTMPQTKPVPKPIMNQEQIITLIGGIKDLHDLCLMYVGIFCGPHASEVPGLQWKSWTGTTLVPYGTAYEGKLYPGRFKTRASKAPIGVPEQVRPVIQAWQQVCPDPSPEALMFPTFGRGVRKGLLVPRWDKNFLDWRIRPIARQFGIPDRLVTFQVMRRTLGTHLQHHGTLKDAQGALRHASIQTTRGDAYKLLYATDL